MVKNLPANVGDMGLIPDLERSSGEGIGNPLQYSCLENPMDRGVWHGQRGHKELDMTQSHTHTHTHTHTQMKQKFTLYTRTQNMTWYIDAQEIPPDLFCIH